MLKSRLSQLCILLCAVMALFSCKTQVEEESQYKLHNVDLDHVSRYVTYPKDSLVKLLALADSASVQFAHGTMDDIGLDDEVCELSMDSIYGDTIPALVRFLAMYDAVTTANDVDEANNSFVWQEFAKCQIAEFYGMKELPEDSLESFVNLADQILSHYGCGAQREMNVSSWRWCAFEDFTLIESYKKLYDCCNSPELKEPILDSYRFLWETYRARVEQIDGRWSDLPRELACMLAYMIEQRREWVDALRTKFMQGSITIDEIKAELDARPADEEGWDISDF